MRQSKITKLATAHSSSSSDGEEEAPKVFPVGVVVPIPRSEYEAADKGLKLLREMLMALGEHDFAVAIAEAKRNEMRVEYQKAQAKHIEDMRIVARLAGIDLKGPEQWDFDADKKSFTRRALARGGSPTPQVRWRQPRASRAKV